MILSHIPYFVRKAARMLPCTCVSLYFRLLTFEAEPVPLSAMQPLRERESIAPIHS
jgi:hypothetical protein